MKIASLFKPAKTVFSFEVFPPKKTASIDSIYKTLEELKELKPDFISVTYGAGGNLADTSTVDIASAIKNIHGIESLAHLTCLNSSREDVGEILKLLKGSNVENILALRGDRMTGVEVKKDFSYASDLIEFIKGENRDLGISAAAYPEGHPECDSIEEDLRNLKNKSDTGADHLVSQLFFDNDIFYSFLDKARKIGINLPVEAGIMPVVNKKQIERMVSLSGASIPPRLASLMDKYGDNPQAMRDAGIAYATEQIFDLISMGVDGIHLYTMNKSDVAKEISDNVRSLL